MKKLLFILFTIFSVNLYSQNKEFNIEKSIYYLASDQLEGRFPSTNGDTLAVEFVENVFKDFNLQPLFNSFFQEVVFKDIHSLSQNSKQAGPKSKLSRNVVAMIQGSDPVLKNEYIVIGAHLDHLGYGGPMSGSRSKDINKVHYGADDNASGVALMLDLARKFSLNPTKRSIIFIAFACEEKGLNGSKQFLEALPFETKKIVAMLNFDMVGKLKNNNLTVGGIKTSNKSEKIVKKYSDKYNLNLKLSKSGVAPSDHASFYAKYIPVFYFTTGADSTYHTPMDKPENINYKGIELLSSYTFDIANDLANRKTKLKFRKTKDPKSNPVKSTLKVSLGIMPDVTGSTDDGLKAEIVSKDKPADKAGMINGDIIIELNGKKVKDIYAYMDILSKIEPKSTISAKIKREGRIKEIKIKL